jgi:hypothetical protein
MLKTHQQSEEDREDIGGFIEFLLQRATYIQIIPYILLPSTKERNSHLLVLPPSIKERNSHLLRSQPIRILTEVILKNTNILYTK